MPASEGLRYTALLHGATLMISFLWRWLSRMKLVGRNFAGIMASARTMRWKTGMNCWNAPKMADCAFVCTQDNQHIAPAMAALQAGYHVVMEKPMSRNADELRELKALAEEKGKLVTVCHVLRYTPFFSKVKELLDAGKIGQLQSVQQIENVAYWHQAHSFVRGNWRREDETSR